MGIGNFDDLFSFSILGEFLFYLYFDFCCVRWECFMFLTFELLEILMVFFFFWRSKTEQFEETVETRKDG